ncbi:MAG: hypothetical protein JEZ08_16565 [Clostridiales bacterium]|nr:hypothetical protein [Clostridiales bacterium]
MKDLMIKAYVVVKRQMKDVLNNETGDAGVGFILTIAAALIVAGFVFIPGLRAFGSTIMAAINSWWTTDISPQIFPSS